jgi:hypothetical protein
MRRVGTRTALRTSVLALAAVAAAGPFACSSRAPSRQTVAGDAAAPFPRAPPQVYVAKVKNLLVGLPPTDDELRAVAADPKALGGLVDGWMALPQYGQKMTRFFELAFQQAQVGSNDFADQVFAQIGINPTTTPLIIQNAEESFARTMVELSSQGRPFTDSMTTGQLMMTTALKELYAYLDVIDINDDGAVLDRFRQDHRTLAIVVEASQGPIPIEQTLDPSSPNYMHWYDPDVTTAGVQVPGCRQDPATFGPKAISLHYLLLGSLDGRTLADGTICPVFGGTPAAPQLTADDFRDWTMVTLRPPNAGEPTATFYDLPALRAARELVLATPRIGFFSTPAFFANWQTNVSNQMRVTTHQALIVATGSSIDGTDTTYAPGTPGLDAAHAGDAACFGCHKILDPTRSILSATWSWYYHNQRDPAWTGQPGVFAFRGVVQPTKTLADFAGALASHPLVAAGWAQKLCYYFDSAPCDETDPEFQRIVALFRTSGFSWNALVRELVTSPLTTYAAETQSASATGTVVAISRRDHMCAALGARLGLPNACGLDALGATPVDTTPLIVSGLPSDAYGRGAVAPILPNDPSLFFVAGVENICQNLAVDVVDARAGSQPPGARQWSSAHPDAAIADFVHEVMALAPSDTRAAQAQAILASHFSAAAGQPGATATDALRSTFVVACMAPSSVTIGL